MDVMDTAPMNDAHDYLPWTWDEVVAKMATLEENKNDIRYRDYDRDKESG
jgi:hypothetical protein